MSETIVIIGAGMAGLSAGCYAQMNGYSSQIFEMDVHPGGLATSWKRGPYVFEAGPRVVSGTSGTSKAHQLWEELGILDQRGVYYYDELACYEGSDGRRFHMYADINRLRDHMLELSPKDREPIEELISALRAFTRMELPVDLTPSNPLEFVQLGTDMLPVMVPVMRWRNVTVGEFARKFRDPLLREALPQMFPLATPDLPMIMLLKTVAKMSDHEAGFPIGGAAQLGDDLAKRYLALGGTIQCRTKIEQIVVEDASANGDRHDRVTGVRLKNGTVVVADMVISAADGRSTIFDLLQGLYRSKAVDHYYKDLRTSYSVLKVSLGVRRDMRGEPSTLDLSLRQPLALGNREYGRMVVNHYCFDPTMAPAGCSSLGIWFDADFEYWLSLRNDREAYRAAKQQVSERVIRALDQRYPGLAAQVEAVDVATPATYERFTGNWRGAYSGWAITNEKVNMIMTQGMRKTLPGLDRFYMIGHWVEPGGGVDLSVASGRDVIKDICHRDGKPFAAGQEPGHALPQQTSEALEQTQAALDGGSG